ncbi:MAG: tRNA (N6-threonylcarbamoyladenosine(37)-N6)-methyltransferase TrmO [Syntrophomonadaceae bacterium]|nr:tRNA (N6-threonylcarbamoyladenosine(37)-N6)-methyltransferase TrmO [Syntrophomonadaceae bacterium]
MEPINYKPIGIIHSPFRKPEGTPIQPSAAKDIEGWFEVFPEYAGGLKDLEGFSHIILLYHLHLAKPYSLLVKPFLDDHRRGVFATRAPSRPNPIGLSIVRLLRIKENKVYIQDVDMVEGTPLLDIKPYVGEFDYRVVSRIGWLEKHLHKLSTMKDDGRFKS